MIVVENVSDEDFRERPRKGITALPLS